MSTQQFKIAKRVEKAQYAIRDPAVAVKVEELKSRGRAILELNIGDPAAREGEYGFHMPTAIKDALVECIRSGGKHDGYARENGEPVLREAVAKDARARGIQDARPESVIVGNGLSEIVDYLLGVLVEPGVNVVLPCPDYPLYTARVNWYGGEVRRYRLAPDNEWQPDPDEIARLVDDQTALVVLISPNNPTGSCLDRATLEAIVRKLEARPRQNAILLADEIYHRLRFDGQPHVPAASLTDRLPIITLDGMSKGFYSPGWRIGHALFSNFTDDSVRKALLKVCALRLSAANAVQHAYAKGLAELGRTADEYATMLGWLRERAEYTHRRLNEVRGVRCVAPRGAFYAFPQVVERGPWESDRAFMLDLLETEGIRIVHGSGFGMAPADLFFRVVTYPSLPAQMTAYDALDRFMKARLR